ncbi:hypothetical protein [Pseudomonas sp. Irchel 3H3]|nr:hypothetical protein [Pseudomonas sp. Irchel 3H3]
MDVLLAENIGTHRHVRVAGSKKIIKVYANNIKSVAYQWHGLKVVGLANA